MAKKLCLKILVSLVFSEVPGSEGLLACLHACSFLRDLRVTANQIICHTFREKSRGLRTRLATVNHRRPFSHFFLMGGGDCTQAKVKLFRPKNAS